MWPTTVAKPEFDDEIGKFAHAELRESIKKYEMFHQLPSGSAVAEHLVNSSAGIRGLFEYQPDRLLKVRSELHDAQLCGLWVKQSLMAAQEMPE